MIRRYFYVFVAAIIMLSGSCFALGKFDVGVYGGGMTSIFSGGRDF